MPRSTARAAVPPVKRRRERIVYVPQFGAHLRRLRGQQTIADVCRAVNAFGFVLDHSTLIHYERGTVKAPDPALLFALAHHYGVKDLDDLIGRLVKERLGRPVKARRVFVSFHYGTFTRDQRRMAQWFGAVAPDMQHALLFVLKKLHAAAASSSTTVIAPIRRRTRR
jgi:transcriptional regulator with XRE-family HTH domain